MNKKAMKIKSIVIQVASVLAIATAIFCIQYFYVKEKDTAAVKFINSGQLEIIIFDVGNADSIFIKNKDQTMLIDAGENNDENKIVERLRREGVSKLDYVIATHPDADHIGGMDAVVKNFKVDRFYMPILPAELTPTTATYIDLLTALDEEDVDVYEGFAGLSFRFGECDISLLSPQKKFSGSSNDFSIVTLITHGKLKFLFMGDAEKSTESYLIDSGVDLRADFLKVGHHGSNTSSTNEFLSKVAPKYCAVTSGQNNRYNHPHLETLERIKSVGAEILRSDISGCITVKSDGNIIEISTQK